MKVEVNKDLCISCGACVSVCPEVFKFDDNGLAEASQEQPDEYKERVIEALKGCPTDAIVEKE